MLIHPLINVLHIFFTSPLLHHSCTGCTIVSSPRLSETKIPVNARIVVVGASDCGLCGSQLINQYNTPALGCGAQWLLMFLCCFLLTKK